jgi:chorismate mutase/prephenate dehydratase
MSLKKIRDSIDKIDSQIVAALNKRAKLVLDIANLKAKQDKKVFSPKREAMILRRIKKLNKGPLKNKDLEFIFKDILSVSRGLQLVLDIAYLGPQGTFTHLASLKKFGRHANFISCNSIKEVFQLVQKQKAGYGVVPVENSIEGAVNYTLDMFFEFDLKICSEIITNISHSLLAKNKKDKILRIYSNPHVFPQCRHWLSKRYPKASLIPVATTAKAAEMAGKDRNGACLGNSQLSELYNLQRIADAVEDFSSNVTRFLVISDNDSSPTGNDKTSILFSVKDKAGVLHRALYAFRKANINLTKIESRPSKRKPWEYYFFVDFKGHRKEPKIKKALDSLRKKCNFLKILGSYPKST